MKITQRFSLRWLVLTTLCASLLTFSLHNPVLADNTGQADPKQASGKTASKETIEKTADKQPTSKEDTTHTEPPPGAMKGEASSQIEDSMANIEIIQQTLESLRQEIETSKEDSSMNRNSVKTIKDGLGLIDGKLKEAYTGLDESRKGVNANTESIKQLKQELLAATRDIRANAAGLDAQKSLVEDNSIRLYEILIQISSMNDKVEQFAEALDNVKKSNPKEDIKLIVGADLNRLWTMLATVLVFFAPLAFVLSSNRDNYKPLLDGTQQHQGALLACLGVFLGYFTIGFGLMYGLSADGWIGTTNYLLSPASNSSNMQPALPFNQFVLFQSGFVMLAALIVYIAVGRQLSSTAHLLLALFVGTVLIPVFGHWAWSSHFIPSNKGWLEGSGFVDQSGAITINAVAAWFAFVVVWKLGRSAPPPQNADQEFDAPVYSSSAALLLWISWLGFTTGTLPISSEQIPAVMLNVGLAASTSGMTAFLHYAFFRNDNSRMARALGGFVSGLVAIAACAQSVSFAEAAVIGAVAGLLQNTAYSFLRKFFLNHSWQARTAYLVAIHGFAGIWGALCVGLFGADGTFSAPDFMQLLTQAQSIAAALAWSIVSAHIALFLLAFRKKRPQAA